MKILYLLKVKILSITWLSEYAILIYTLIAAILIPLILYLLSERSKKRSELKKYFKNGSWIKSSKIVYRDFDFTRPDSIYLHRNDVENQIKSELLKGKHVVLLGLPLRGKTRVMVEVLRQLKQTYILQPNHAAFPPNISFPRHSGKMRQKVVVLNDLNGFYDSGYNANTLIDAALQNGFQILANCRTTSEWKNLVNILGDSRKSIFMKIEVPEASIHFAKEVAEINHLEALKVLDGYDNNIGYVFIPTLNAMQIRYTTKLTVPGQQILIGIKELDVVGKKDAGGFILLEDIKIICKQRNLTLSDREWHELMQQIIDLDFGSGSTQKIIPEPVYLERIVYPEIPIKEIVTHCKTAFPNYQIKTSNFFNRAENAAEIANIVSDLNSIGFKLDPATYNYLIMQSSYLSKAQNIIELMIDTGIQPDVVSYTLLLNYCQDYVEGLKIIDKMYILEIKPNVVTFSMLMNKCANYEQGEKVLDLMKEKKIQPNVFTFSTLMNKCANYEQGEKVLDLMKEKKIQPNVFTFSTLMNKCADYEQGEKVLDLMKEKKIQPDVFTFNTLMNKCADYEQGEKVLDLMKEKKIQPDVFTFSTLMNKCADYEQGEKVLDLMKEKKIQPDVFTFNTLMNKCADYKQGEKVLDLMKEKKIQPDVFTFNTLMNKCADYEQGEKVLDLMKEKKIQPDVFTFNTLMNKCADYKQGEKVLDLMKEKKIQPDVVTFVTFLNKISTTDEMIDWFEIFCKSGIRPNSYIARFSKSFKALIYNDLRVNEVLKQILEYNYILFFEYVKEFDTEKIISFINKYPELAHRTDENKLGFASYFIHNNEFIEGKNVLDTVNGKNYYYWQIYGNYFNKYSDFQKAEQCFLSALQIAKNDNQKGQMHLNIALIIKIVNDKNRFMKGIDLCETALNLMGSDNSFLPKNLLSFFIFSTTTKEDLLTTINNLKLKYNIGLRSIKWANNNLTDPDKKALIKEYLISRAHGEKSSSRKSANS